MLTRNKLSFFHDGSKLFGEGRSTPNLVSEQVSSGKVDEIILLYKDIALARLANSYVPLPEPGPPSTKSISAGFGGFTWAAVSWFLKDA